MAATKPGEIADHAAAERDDHGFPVVPGADHLAAEGFRMGHRLRGLAGGHRVQRGVETGGFERVEQRPGMEAGDRFIADDRRAAAGESGVRDEFPGLARGFRLRRGHRRSVRRDRHGRWACAEA